MFQATFSTHGPVPKYGEATALPEKDGIPPDVHGDQPFIVKVQKPALQFDTGDADATAALRPMLIYDRQRSFKVWAMAPDNPDTHGQFWETVLASPTRMKVYRWAKRTGSHELTICLDREPSPVPLW